MKDMQNETHEDIDEGLNPFAMFATNNQAETKGVEIDYGAFYFTVARAGGANKKFTQALNRRMKPYRRLIQEERMPDVTANQILHETVAETVILGWGSAKHGDGKMIGENGEAIEFSRANVVSLFERLPDLFQDLFGQAQTVSLYRENEEEVDKGN